MNFIVTESRPIGAGKVVWIEDVMDNLFVSSGRKS